MALSLEASLMACWMILGQVLEHSVYLRCSFLEA